MPSWPKDTYSLQDVIDLCVTDGFSVDSQTETSALLMKPKGRFAWGWFIFWWILPVPGFPALIYLIYHYFIKKKRVVELYVAEGKVERR